MHKEKKRTLFLTLTLGTADKQPQVMFRFDGSVVYNHSLSLDSYHIKKALKINKPLQLSATFKSCHFQHTLQSYSMRGH